MSAKPRLYTVTLDLGVVRCTGRMTVEATSPEEAREKAQARIDNQHDELDDVEAEPDDIGSPRITGVR